MKIGFIGCGNMGGAMMHGILDSGKCTQQELMASDALEKALEARKEEMGILAAKDNKETAAFADVLFLAVKPQYYQSVIEEIRDTPLPRRWKGRKRGSRGTAFGSYRTGRRKHENCGSGISGSSQKAE